VFFRQSTRIEAERLGVHGMARNLADGSVEVVAQGDAAALAALHDWLRQGPSQARVDAVRETNDAPEPQIPAPGKFVVR
jgi:acylphosphatase